MKQNNRYTPTNKTSKFSTMWHWTNIATDPRSSYNQKIVAINEMHDAVISETMEHFLSALREVLRSAKSHDDFTPRMKAIDILVEYSKWEDVEWTLWLHEQRDHCSLGEFLHIKKYRRRKENDEYIAEQVNKLEQHIKKLGQKATMEAIP